MQALDIIYATVVPTSLGITVFFIKRYISNIDTKIDTLQELSTSNKDEIKQIKNTTTLIKVSSNKILSLKNDKIIDNDLLTKILKNSLSNNNSLNTILKILERHNIEIKNIKNILNFNNLKTKIKSKPQSKNNREVIKTTYSKKKVKND